jgi:hypothetical protein
MDFGNLCTWGCVQFPLLISQSYNFAHACLKFKESAHYEINMMFNIQPRNYSWKTRSSID